MRKTMMAMACAALCGCANLGDGKLGNVPVADAKARGAQLLTRAAPLLEMAAAGDSKAAAALSLILPREGQESPAGAVTNVVEAMPDKTLRIITNPVFLQVVAPPVFTPIANVAPPPLPIAPPAATNPPSSFPGGSIPGGGASIDNNDAGRELFGAGK